MNRPSHAVDADALQARYALRIAARLNEQTAALSHATAERLRVARERALRRAHRQRAQAHRPATAWSGSRAAVSLGRGPSGWSRLASALPLLLLLIGLALIEQAHRRSEIHAAADVDAALLADDLPPEAYRDPGFVAYLKRPEP